MQSALDALNETSDTVSELASAPQTAPEQSRRSRASRRSMTVTLSSVLRMHPSLATPERLNAASQCITDLDNVPARFCGISTLYLSGNALCKLTSLPQFANVQTLSLAQNKLSSWLELQWLLALPRLTHLRLEGNPLCSSPLYRMRAVSLLCSGQSSPSLQSLDGVPIRPSDRQTAQRVVQWYDTILAQMVASEQRIHQLALLVKLSAVHLELLGVYWNDGRGIMQATGVALSSSFPAHSISGTSGGSRQAAAVAQVLRKVVHNGPALRGSLPELAPPNYNRLSAVVANGTTLCTGSEDSPYQQYQQQPPVAARTRPCSDASLVHNSYCTLVERKLKSHLPTAAQHHIQEKENHAAAGAATLPAALAPRHGITDAGAAVTSILHMSRAQNLSGLLAVGTSSAHSATSVGDLAGAGLSPALAQDISQWAHASSSLAGAQAAVIQELHGLLVAAEVRAVEQVQRLGGRDSGRKLEHTSHVHGDQTGRRVRTSSLRANRSNSFPATVKQVDSTCALGRGGAVSLGVQASLSSVRAPARPRATAARRDAAAVQQWSASQQRRRSAAFADSVSSTRPGPPMASSPSRPTGRAAAVAPDTGRDAPGTIPPASPQRVPAAAPVRSLPEEEGRAPLPGLQRTYDRTVYAEPRGQIGSALVQADSASSRGERSSSTGELVSGSTRSGPDVVGRSVRPTNTSSRPRSAPATAGVASGRAGRRQEDVLYSSTEVDAAVPIGRSVSSLTRGQVRAVIARSKDVLDALRKARLQYGSSSSTSPESSSTGSTASRLVSGQGGETENAPLPGIAQASAARAAGLANKDAATGMAAMQAPPHEGQGLGQALHTDVGVQAGPAGPHADTLPAAAAAVPSGHTGVPRVLQKLLSPSLPSTGAPTAARTAPHAAPQQASIPSASQQSFGTPGTGVPIPAGSPLHQQLSALPVPSLVQLVERLTAKVQEYERANEHNARVATASISTLRVQLEEAQHRRDSLQSEHTTLLQQVAGGEVSRHAQEKELQQKVAALEAGLQRAESDKRLLAEALHRSESAKDRAWDTVSTLQQQVYEHEREERLRGSPWAVDTKQDPFEGTDRGHRSPSPAGARAVPLAALVPRAPSAEGDARPSSLPSPPFPTQQQQQVLARAVPLRPVAVSPPPPPTAVSGSTPAAAVPSPRIRAGSAGVLFQAVTFGPSSPSPTASASLAAGVASPTGIAAAVLGSGSSAAGRATPTTSGPSPSAPPRSPAPGHEAAVVTADGRATSPAQQGLGVRVVGQESREDITAWALRVASSSSSSSSYGPGGLPQIEVDAGPDIDLAVDELNERALEPTARRVLTAVRAHALQRVLGTWKHALAVERTGLVLESRAAGSLALSALARWRDLAVARRQKARAAMEAPRISVRRESITGLAQGPVAAPVSAYTSHGQRDAGRVQSVVPRGGPAAVDGVTAVVASILQQQRYRDGSHGGASTGSHSLEAGSEGGSEEEGGAGSMAGANSVPLELSALTTDLHTEAPVRSRTAPGLPYSDSGQADLSAVLLDSSMEDGRDIDRVDVKTSVQSAVPAEAGEGTRDEPQGRGRTQAVGRGRAGIGFSIYNQHTQPAAPGLSYTVDSLPSLSSLVGHGRNEATQAPTQAPPPATTGRPSVVGRPGADGNRATEEWKHSLRGSENTAGTIAAGGEAVSLLQASADRSSSRPGVRKRSVSSTASRRGSLSRVVVLPHAYLSASSGTGGGAVLPSGARRASRADSLEASSKRGPGSRRGSARASPDSLRVPSPAPAPVPIGHVVPLMPSMPSAVEMIRQAVGGGGGGGGPQGRVRKEGGSEGARSRSPTATHGSMTMPQLQAASNSSSASSLAATQVVDDGVRVRVLPAASHDLTGKPSGSTRRIGHERVLPGRRADDADSSALVAKREDSMEEQGTSKGPGQRQRHSARGRAPFR